VLEPGLPDVYFQTQNPILGKFLGPLNGKGWYILGPFGFTLHIFCKFYGHYMGNLVAIWCIFPRFGTLCPEKSGNPAPIFQRRQV
jgi:hypothetical protein